MNKTNPAQKYFWLFSLGMGLQTVGISLAALNQDNPASNFASGFVIGVACVAMGAYIYLAASSLHKGTASEGDES